MKLARSDQYHIPAGKAEDLLNATIQELEPDTAQPEVHYLAHEIKEFILSRGEYLKGVRSEVQHQKDADVLPALPLDIPRPLRQLGELPGFSLLRGKKRSLYGLTERELIQRESEIGRELFGSIPKGHRREFFTTDPRVWIWHEEWIDEAGKPQQLTTKYEVRHDGVWKVQPGPRYTLIKEDELDNFNHATKVYVDKVTREIYRRDPLTGEKLL